MADVSVAVLGLVNSIVIFVLPLPAMWQRPNESCAGTVRRAAVGFGTVLYLLIAELFAIDAMCLWCTAVPVLTFVLFVTTAYASVSYLSAPQPLGLRFESASACAAACRGNKELARATSRNLIRRIAGLSEPFLDPIRIQLSEVSLFNAVPTLFDTGGHALP